MAESVQAFVQEDCEVVRNELYAANRFIMSIKSEKILPLVKPGHTIYIRVPGMEGRAVKTHFPIFDIDEKEGTISVLYYVVGYATACMVRVLPGHVSPCEGPLDNPWPVSENAKRVMLYGNEMGPSRLCLLAKQLRAQGVEVDAVVEGATSGAVAAFERQLEPYGVNVITVTKDKLGDVFGEIGRRAYMADMLATHQYDCLVACASEEVLEELQVNTFVLDLPYYSALDFWNPVTR